MSDIGTGGEASILGTAAFQPQNFRQRMAFGRKGVTANVQASLKFDIPGLRDFRTEIKNIREALESLDKTFRHLADAPKKWVEELKKANVEMVALRKSGGGQIGGVGAPGAATGQIVPVTETPHVSAGDDISTAAGRAGVRQTAMRAGTALLRGEGAQGALGAMGAGAGPAAAGAAAGAAISSALQSLFSRFDRGLGTTAQADVYTSRNALFTGRTAQQTFSQQGSRALPGIPGLGGGMGGMPFYGNMPEIEQVLNQMAMTGMVVGGRGIAGQRGAAAATNVQQMQALTPGMTAGQAGGMMQNLVSNVQAQKQGMTFFGRAALMYKPGGGMKTMSEYFTGILTKLEQMPRPDGTRGPWSKDQLEAQMYPGSHVNTWLTMLGMDEDTQGQFWQWAIARATAGNPANFQPTQQEMDKLRGGKSLATESQQLETMDAKRNAKFAGRQYDNMLTRLDREEAMVKSLTSIDDKMSSVIGLLGGNVPKAGQGLAKKGGGVLGGALVGGAAGAFLAPETLGLSIPAGALAGGIAGFFAGDPQRRQSRYMGDPETSLSHLEPGMRDRVGALMEANPNITITSAYRDNLRQQQLSDAGDGQFAPSGKSRHGSGQAVDLGPPEQFDWLAANASGFGLETAGDFGEPWHLQRTGTLVGFGDPADDLRRRANFYNASFQQAVAASSFAGTSASGSVDTGAAGVSGTGAAGTGASGAGAATGVGTGTSGPVSVDEMVKIAHAAGFSGQALVNMVGIARRESGWDPTAHRSNTDKSLGRGDRGLWQINWVHDAALKKQGIIKNWSDLLNPVTNAKAAFYLSGGGQNLSPWNAGKGGFTGGGSPFYHVNADWLAQAKTAATKAGYMGDVGGRAHGARSGGGGAVSVNPITITNNFSLSFPGGQIPKSSDVDVVAKKLASRLEVHVRRAVSRTN